ncbi:homoserine O-succinyltransferase [Hoeflea sp. WL0058]|uniref:Homoserine O-acetyltransferase n=1 Tax=Flavimaribacter sediminis TaxID=2865987 RepID=A0AAE2ZK33_9HYPH|nr:homoserine O-succinyltransferase [Flavimaribacter sediminis]MBW8637646.1 homoserine O-succinyltransferase [Flavimaribacter sediminis]
MTLFVPKGFDAVRELVAEGRPVQVGRPEQSLRIGLLNLMPKKKIAERQFARLLSTDRHSVDLTLLHMAGHRARHCPTDYLNRVYRPATIGTIARLDGLIVTGAPIEHLEFCEVDYWEKLAAILDFARDSHMPALFICWAAQAALYRYYGVAKQPLQEKAFGVFPQHVLEPRSEIVAGLGPVFPTPVSRHTTIKPIDVLKHPGSLKLIAGCDRTGPALVEDRVTRSVYMFNHLEYEEDTLQKEYLRDRLSGHSIREPLDHCNVASSGKIGEITWGTTARRFFSNWLDRVSVQSCLARRMKSDRKVA